MKYITTTFWVMMLINLGCSGDRKSKGIESRASVVDNSAELLNKRKMPLFIASAGDTFYSIKSNFPGGEAQYFEDISLLTGRYKMNKLSYPCIEIRNTENKRIVVYHFDSTSTSTYVYQKYSKYWLARYFSKGDTCRYYYTFDYILPDRQIAFTYSNKEATRFSDVMIADQSRESIYMPHKGFTISPKLANIDSLLSNYDYKHETILAGNINRMKVRTVRTTKGGVIEIDIDDCYENPEKEYSVVWWQLFAWQLLKKAVCY